VGLNLQFQVDAAYGDPPQRFLKALASVSGQFSQSFDLLVGQCNGDCCAMAFASWESVGGPSLIVAEVACELP
jgi:hypothetical protein